MTAQEKLNKAAQSHGWANWSEVLLHNAPAHVINLIVEDAMRTQQESKPALEWRPGARVRITKPGYLGAYAKVVGGYRGQEWSVELEKTNTGCLSGGSMWIAESDAVVVG